VIYRLVQTLIPSAPINRSPVIVDSSPKTIVADSGMTFITRELTFKFTGGPVPPAATAADFKALCNSKRRHNIPECCHSPAVVLKSCLPRSFPESVYSVCWSPNYSLRIVHLGRMTDPLPNDRSIFLGINAQTFDDSMGVGSQNHGGSKLGCRNRLLTYLDHDIKL